MYCKNCGKKISEKAKVCPNCGEPTQIQISMNISKLNISNDKLNIIGIIGCVFVFLSVFMPFVSVFGYTKSILDGSDDLICDFTQIDQSDLNFCAYQMFEGCKAQGWDGGTPSPAKYFWS